MAAPARQLLRREERQASILHGAAEAFARSGFAATSMDDVAAACGVTKLILYRHFDSKADLYRAVLQRVFERLGEELQAGLARGTARGLGMRTLLTVAREDPAAFTLLWRHATREPQFAEYAHQLRELAASATRQLMGLDSGDELLDHWGAETTIGWLVEAVLVWLELGTPERDDDASERASDALVAMREAWSR